MPKLKIPFILRNSLKTDQEIDKLLYDYTLGIKDLKVITTLKNGHMILWKMDAQNNTLKPNLYLMPSLTRYIGKVQNIILTKNSLNHVMVSTFS